MARPKKLVAAPEPEIVSVLTTSRPETETFVIPEDGSPTLTIYVDGKLYGTFARGAELELTPEQITQIKQCIPA